jgi:hypothetical protein
VFPVVFFVLVFGAFVLGVIPRIQVGFSQNFFKGNMDGCFVHLWDRSCALKHRETTSIQGFSVGVLVFGGAQRIRDSQ